MQRIEHEVLALIRAGMTRNHLGAAGNDNLMDIAFDQNLSVPEGRRHQVVVAAIANQRQRVDTAWPFLAGVVWSWQRLLERSKIPFQPLTDRAVMATQPVRRALPALVQKMRVQRLEVGEHRNRHKEVAPCVADEPFHLAFVVTLARPPKPIREQVMRLQLVEHAGALTTAIPQDAGDRDLAIVVEDRLRHAAEELERFDVPIAELFRPDTPRRKSHQSAADPLPDNGSCARCRR